MNNKQGSFKKFLVLWSGTLISALGGGLTSFGLGVYVFQQSGLVSHVSIVMLLAFLPTLLLSAPAGVLADRYDRRILMLLGDSLSAIGPLFILICMLQGEVQLWQICVGVTINSVFSSLIEPAYRATVTDLLTEEQFTKASGFVQLAGSAKYLLAPIIAGFLLKVSDIKLILILDISTFLVTLVTTLVVRKGLAAHKQKLEPSFIAEFKEGWHALTINKGVMTLVWMGTLMTLCLGFIQTLASPMILRFSDSAALGTVQSVIAMGMLAPSILLGLFALKKGYVNILSGALFATGIFMALFGVRENLLFITIAGFLFFTMLPLVNMCIDYLLRTNLSNEMQGRAWGLIGLISQLGYVVAYAASGLLVDKLLTPLLQREEVAQSLSWLLGAEGGRGAALLIVISGALLCVTALILSRMPSIRALEKEGEKCSVA